MRAYKGTSSYLTRVQLHPPAVAPLVPLDPLGGGGGGFLFGIPDAGFVSEGLLSPDGGNAIEGDGAGERTGIIGVGSDSA